MFHAHAACNCRSTGQSDGDGGRDCNLQRDGQWHAAAELFLAAERHTHRRGQLAELYHQQCAVGRFGQPVQLFGQQRLTVRW